MNRNDDILHAINKTLVKLAEQHGTISYCFFEPCAKQSLYIPTGRVESGTSYRCGVRFLHDRHVAGSGVGVSADTYQDMLQKFVEELHNKYPLVQIEKAAA